MHKGTKGNRKSRKGSGKPPRWLVLGALAASAASTTPAMAGRFVAPTQAQEAEKWTLTARREDLALAGELAPLAPDTAPRRAVPSQDLSVRRFDIPRGPMSEALAAFEKTTGVKVQAAKGAAEGVESPGASGLFTVDQALQELLAGTVLTYRFTDARTVSVDVTVVSETIDVTTTPAPSSPKYTEPLNDTPQTVTVIPQTLIQEQGATTLRDVLRNVTGISIQAGEGGGGLPGDNLSIRGFAARNDLFVDGVRDFGAYTRDPFNIEQVEVAKGPGSVYTGRGSTGGSLNLSSKKPQLSGTNGATVGAGTDSYARGTVDLNHRLDGVGIEGTALRVNAMWTQSDTPGRDAVENERWGVAPSLSFGLGTPTRWTLSYSHLAQDNLPEYGLPWVPATNIPLASAGYADKPAPVSFENFYGLTDRDYEDTVTGLSTAVVEHDFNSSLTLRSLLRHGRSTRDSIITAPRFADNVTTNINRQIQSRDLEDTILAQQNDLTGHFETGNLLHDVVAGVEATRETSKNYARSGPAAPLADLFDPNPDDPYSGPITRTGARTKSLAKTGAVYVSDTVKWGDRWQFLGGLRWDHFDVDFESVAVDGVVSPFENTDRMLSWRGGVVHKPAANGSVYAAYGTSFNPSADGNTGLALSTSLVELEPEKSRSFEVGTKWGLGRGRLDLTAALFRTEKTNARTPGVNPGDPPTVLEGEQRVDGLEFGVSGRLADGWTTFFSYTYLDGEVLESNVPAEVGKVTANTPDHSVSLWTTYRLPFGFEVGGGAQYVGERYSSNTNTRLAPDYWLLDATAAYEVNDQFTLRLNVNNLTDEEYIDRIGGGHFIPGASRSVSLTTSLGF